MSPEKFDTQAKGAFAEGINLVWRRQRLVWWVFVVCLIISHFAASNVIARVTPFLDYSPAAEALLARSFHFTAIIELNMRPAEYLDAGTTPGHYALIFFLFLLLATGGIIESYWRDATLTTAEFFQSCGFYFWRFVRLVCFLILCLIPVGILAAILEHITETVDKNSVSVMPGIWAQILTVTILLILLMILRLWFDMAEVIAVAEGEVRSRRCLARSAALLRRHFGTLFWLYFRISVIAGVLFFIGIHFIASFRHTSIRVELICLQILVLFWIWARLWQRASETIWYKRYLISLP